MSMAVAASVDWGLVILSLNSRPVTGSREIPLPAGSDYRRQQGHGRQTTAATATAGCRLR